MPGSADGAGGGAATLGYDPKSRLTPLTTNLGEFAPQISEENREIAQYGWFFQGDDEVRAEHNVPMGPANPQVLNRYSYVNNNPVRYTDPTGHCGPACAVLIPVGVGLGVTFLAMGGIYYYGVMPNAAQNREALVAGLSQLAEGAQNRYNETMVVPTLIATLGSEAIRSNINVLFAQDGRPRSNQAQNKQFNGAIKEAERQLGRKLDKDEREQVHRALQGQDADFWDIVDEALNLFDKGSKGGK